MRLLPILPALLVAALAPAQVHVFPAQAVDTEGETSVMDHTGGAPWWSVPDNGPGSQEFRMQVIYDLPASVKGSLKSIRYRRDAKSYPTFPLLQFLIEVEVKISTSPGTSATASTTFANNVGSDETTVIARRRMAMGSQNWAGTFPEPFFYTLPFDAGVTFPYDGSQGSLCVEVTHFYNDLLHPQRPTPQVVEIDAMTSSKTGFVMRSGSRCATAREFQDPISFVSTLEIDDSAGSPRLRFFGFRENAEFHSRGYMLASTGLLATGLPAPRLAGAPPSCGSIRIDPAQMFLVSLADSDDFGSLRWPETPGTYLFDVPYNPFLAGFPLYTQELNYDIHTTGFATSNYCVNQVPVFLGSGSTFGVRTVHASGPGSATLAQGALGTLGLGPVTEFN